MRRILTFIFLIIIGTIAYGKSEDIKDGELMKYASAGGAYKRLIHLLKVPEDSSYYGEYYVYGYWDGESYGGYHKLSPGYWVYLYPNWYVWAEMNQPIDDCGG